jgi:transglutaminase-like putative cysteine protease
MFPLPLLGAPGDVKTTLDCPCKYPSGLASDGKSLFVADWREARIYELTPADGKLVRTFAAPTLKPAGLAYGAARLFVSDDHTGGIYAMNLDGALVEATYQAPESRATGLAYADGVLFVLAKDRIYKVMPEDGTIIGSFDAPEKSCSCLAHDGKYLWVSNRNKDELYLTETQHGKVLGIVKSPGPYPAGLAWHDGYLWNVDFQTRKLYQIEIDGDQPYKLFDPRRARVEYLWSLSNYGPGEVRDLVLSVAVPRNLLNQKMLSDAAFSRPPSKEAEDQWGQRSAVFQVGTVAGGSKEVVSYSVSAEVSAIRYLIRPERTGRLADIPADIREKYTVDGTHLRIDSPYIRKTVKKVVGQEENPYWIARKIYDFVISRLEYQMAGGWDIPEEVLRRGQGSCSEYTYVFVALCRAAGLPARYQGSIVVRGDDASIDEAFHRWAEIYLPNYGWIPVDANRGDAPSPVDQARGFGELSNRFLITTVNGGDSPYLGWGYNSFCKYRQTGYCKVEEDNFGLWEPLEPAGPAADKTKPSTGETADQPAICKPPPTK